MGVSTRPAWLYAEPTSVPEGWVGLPASSLLFSVTHPEEHSIPGCEPRKESFALRAVEPDLIFPQPPGAAVH